MISALFVAELATISTLPSSSREEIVRRGDIVYGVSDLDDLSRWVTSYLGNGHLGGCFDHLGTMGVDGLPGSPDPIGGTYFCSLYHFVHAKFGMDYALPIARLQVAQQGVSANPDDISRIADFEQRLALYDGILRTEFSIEGGGSFQREQFFSQVRKNLFVMRTRCSGTVGAILDVRLLPVSETPFHYGQHFQGKARFHKNGETLAWEVSTGDATTWAALLVDSGPGAKKAAIENGLRVEMGVNEELVIWIALVSDPEAPHPEEAAAHEILNAREAGFERVLQEHVDWWRDYWQESVISLPGVGDDIQKLWLRGNYYLGCSLSDRKAPHPPLVFGLAEVGWPSYFPQDFLFLYQNTLSANHLRHAASTADFWFDLLPHVQEYARRMFQLPGAYYPWTPPLFLWHDYHHDGVPNNCYYEHHNQAYVARMVWDYADFTGDREFLRTHAYPVLREIAGLYGGMMSLDPETGKYEIRFTPSKSQDEYAPAHQANYFDCLLSAEYALRKAVRCARLLDVDENLFREWDQILEIGFAYSKLVSRDLYVAYEGDDRGGGSEKHPVQLNPIALLPVEHLYADPRVHHAYEQRYEITLGYDRDEAHAWTLGEFMLASARTRDAEGFREDLRRMRSCKLVDPRLIQVFESTGSKPHFMTTQGLIMEAITECFVQWWKGEIEPWPLLLPEWVEASREEPVWFENIRAPGGFLVSGRLAGASQEVEVRSEFAEPLRIRIPPTWEEGALLAEGRRPLARARGGEVIAVDTHRESIYRLVRQKDSGE